MTNDFKLMHPWENAEALGATTGELLKSQGSWGCFLIVAYKAEHVKQEDCVEHEVLWLTEKDKLSIVMLSEKPWKPVWRKVSERHARAGNNLVVGQYEIYYNVLLNLNGTLQKLWLSEKLLEKFIWEEAGIEKIW